MSATTQPTASSTLVREGHYPYPEENVFLVSAVNSPKARGSDFALAGMVIVARRAELAVEFFNAVAPNPEAWDSLSCWTFSEMKSAAQKIDSEKSRAPSLGRGFFSFGRKEPWVILCADEANARRVEVVIASSFKAVHAHASASGANILGIFPETSLMDLVGLMEQTRLGHNKKEKYASDIRNGELEENLAEIASGYSVEIAESIRQRAARRAAKQGGADEMNNVEVAGPSSTKVPTLGDEAAE
ncbi:hypothetical protein LA345_12680 [Burkholderia vietnamiensis]|nr:hypothetical protein [Burkholderia vietnamiensis]